MKNIYDDSEVCANIVLDNVSKDPNICRKITLARAVVAIFQSNGYTQSQASKVLKTTQPRISNLVNGKLKEFSIDFLITALEELGFDVALTITRRNHD